MSANRCYEPKEGPYKAVDIRRYTNFIRGLRVSGIMLFTQKIYMYDYIRTSFLTIKIQIKKIRHAKETGKKQSTMSRYNSGRCSGHGYSQVKRR